MIELEYDEAVALLDRAVAEQGEEHLAEDHYFKDGEPHCIIGHVLAYKGLDINSSEYEGEFPYEGVGVHRIRGLRCDGRTSRLLSLAQEYQDQGRYWGDAVADAKRKTEGYREVVKPLMS